MVGLATRAGQFARVEQEVDGIDEQPFPGGPIRGQPCRVQHQVAGGGPPGLDGQALRRDGDLGREFRIGNDRRRYPVAQPGPVVMGQLRGSQVQGRPVRRSKIMIDCRPYERMGEGDPVFQPGGLLDQQRRGDRLLQRGQRRPDLREPGRVHQLAGPTEHRRRHGERATFGRALRQPAEHDQCERAWRR